MHYKICRFKQLYELIKLKYRYTATWTAGMCARRGNFDGSCAVIYNRAIESLKKNSQLQLDSISASIWSMRKDFFQTYWKTKCQDPEASGRQICLYLCHNKNVRYLSWTREFTDTFFVNITIKWWLNGKPCHMSQYGKIICTSLNITVIR